ncbi:MAG: NRDE family protein [Planctomycetota bacterium]|nr:NRDE family protein [Planctomycetota bacterium]
MCLLAIQYQSVLEAPILVAANREEFYERPSAPPSIQSGKPRILCGTDERAGGTWLGVNQHGMFVAACNRPKSDNSYPSRSRGTLCRDLLRAASARDARNVAREELATGRYSGVNYVCVDLESGWVIHGADELEAVELREGLSIIGACNVNDTRDERVELARRLLTLQTLDSHVKFLAVSSKVFSRPPSPAGRASIIRRDPDRGTVSSTLVSLGKKPRDAIYQYAAGAPDEATYNDFSPFLRDILSRGLRESRTARANLPS